MHQKPCPRVRFGICFFNPMRITKTAQEPIEASGYLSLFKFETDDSDAPLIVARHQGDFGAQSLFMLLEQVTKYPMSHWVLINRETGDIQFSVSPHSAEKFSIKERPAQNEPA